MRDCGRPASLQSKSSLSPCPACGLPGQTQQLSDCLLSRFRAGCVPVPWSVCAQYLSVAAIPYLSALSVAAIPYLSALCRVSYSGLWQTETTQNGHFCTQRGQFSNNTAGTRFIFGPWQFGRSITCIIKFPVK